MAALRTMMRVDCYALLLVVGVLNSSSNNPLSPVLLLLLLLLWSLLSSSSSFVILQHSWVQIGSNVNLVIVSFVTAPIEANNQIGGGVNDDNVQDDDDNTTDHSYVTCFSFQGGKDQCWSKSYKEWAGHWQACRPKGYGSGWELGTPTNDHTDNAVLTAGVGVYKTRTCGTPCTTFAWTDATRKKKGTIVPHFVYTVAIASTVPYIIIHVTINEHHSKINDFYLLSYQLFAPYKKLVAQPSS